MHLHCNVCNGGQGDSGHPMNSSITQTSCLWLSVHRTGRGKDMFISLYGLVEHEQFGSKKQVYILHRPTRHFKADRSRDPLDCSGNLHTRIVATDLQSRQSHHFVAWLSSCMLLVFMPKKKTSKLSRTLSETSPGQQDKVMRLSIHDENHGQFSHCEKEKEQDSVPLE